MRSSATPIMGPSSPPDLQARALAAFDALVDLPHAARAEALVELRAGSPALADEVERLLAADAAEGAVDDGIVGLAPTMVAGDWPVSIAPRLAPGDVVGPFRLVRPLGEGGMGEVWLGERGGGEFRQQVALKLLKRGMAGADLLVRFRRERRILADLSHPGIAGFIDGGVHGDGTPWYAMAYVDGVPITEHARRAGLDVRSRVALLAEVAEAVAYAQARLVVHRDIKPSNILVDAAGRPHLLDFGIAKLLDRSLDAAETATGLRAMSPAYAAPEQVLGTPVSTATDVYALGVVLYELLCGELPHTRAGAALARLAEQVRVEVFERPSARLARATASGAAGLRDVAAAAGAVRGELDAIVLMALRAEPERRYAGAAAFAADLRRWLGGRPVAAQADTPWYRLRKFAGRNRIAFAAGVAALLALAVGAGAALWQADLARAEAARANAAAERSERIKAFFASLFRSSGPGSQRRGAELTAREWVLMGAERVERELGDDPAAQAEIRAALGVALVEFDAMADARPLLVAAAGWYRAHEPEPRRGLVTVLQNLTNVERRTGNHVGAAAHLEQAIEINERDPDEGIRRETRLRLNTTRLLLANEQGDHAAALGIAQQQIADREALHGIDSPRVAVDWNNLGQTLVLLERSAEAEHALRRALALIDADPQSPESRRVYLLSGIANAEIGQGYLDRARDSATEALAISQRTLGAWHQLTLRSVNSLAAAQLLAGDYAGVIAGASRLRAAPPDVDRHSLKTGLLQLGRAELALDAPAEALADLEAARAMGSDGAFASPVTDLSIDIAYAQALARLGRVDEALPIALAALASLDGIKGARGHRHAEAELAGAEVLAAAGQGDVARARRERALALWQQRWAAAGTAVPADRLARAN
jgi:serine/threonine-protein kinase